MAIEAYNRTDVQLIKSATAPVMPATTRSIEELYNEAIDAMTPAERFGRSAAMFEWTREQIARQIIAERKRNGETTELGPHALKLMVGLRMYASDPLVCQWIERRLKHVSD